LAISRQKKDEVLAQYQTWLENSQAVVLVEYTGVTVKQLDNIRAKIRESGGEFHIVKNTLVSKALENQGMQVPQEMLVQSTAMTFAFDDAAATAKALTEAIKGIEAVKFKGGLLDKQVISPEQVKALASLPPLPAIRSQLLGVLQAPAGKLVRTIAEPARSLATVFQAYADTAEAAA
jgi:large subunit ribosomal protein L10